MDKVKNVQPLDVGDDHPIPHSLATLILYAMSRGVVHVDDELTMLVPPMDIRAEAGGIGKSVHTGEWELTLKKVSD